MRSRRMLGKANPALAVIIVGAIVMVTIGAVESFRRDTSEPTPDQIRKRLAEQEANREASAQVARRDACTRDAPRLEAEADAAIKANQPQQAVHTLNPCVEFLSQNGRLLLGQAREQADKRAASLARAALAEERAKRRREGVRIGMSQDEVLQSSWGKPRTVNRTITQHSTREQWVYGDGNYLYFTDGVLTAVQN